MIDNDKQMKKDIKLIIPSAFGFLAALLFILSSCDKMNDIQEEFASPTEQVYLGKVDSIKFYSGFRRAKITWYIGSDPKIDRTIIYWNMRKDSLVKEFVRSTPGVQKDSVILENLPEGSTLFEFRNVNDEGQTSLYSSATVTAWGVQFGEGLRARKLQAFDFSYEESIYNLTLSPSSDGDNVLFSEIVYTDKLGKEHAMRIEREESDVSLTNFPDGGEFKFRTVFFPPQGIDTVYNSFGIFKAPTAVFGKGVKIALTGNMTSKYFDRNGESIYEWKTNGDLVVYALNPDGSLSQTISYPSLVPRNVYRDFFFYDDDKFIAVSTGNALSMHQIENNELIFVKTPAGANTFGSGFSHQKYIPTKGFFYAFTASTGELRTWVARNNATFATPNGATVGTGYQIYDPLAMFNHQALLGVDSEGYLWSTPVAVSGALSSKSRIGRGWNRFKQIISMGTKVYGMEANGDIYLFNDFNTTNNFWIVD